MHVRVLGAALFIGGGSSLLFASLFGAPFWYFVVFCSLPVLGLFWIWRPPLAAGLSIGPLIVVLSLLPRLAVLWSSSRVGAVLMVTGLTMALALVITTMRASPAWHLPVVVSVVFVVVAFASDRLFTNKLSVRTYHMDVGIDAKVPWHVNGAEWSTGSASPTVVLYRRVADGYCYDAFWSEELRNRLASRNARTATVEYSIVSDFGHERRYDLRSVDGLLASDPLVTNALRKFGWSSGHIRDKSTPVVDCLKSPH